MPIGSTPAREQFGVSTARRDAGNAPPSAPEIAALDWKGNALCTSGFEKGAQTLRPAESGQQLVDQRLRCAPYDRLDFDYFRTGWSNLL